MVSRGLNSGQIKFVERKDLLFREFPKEHGSLLSLKVFVRNNEIGTRNIDVESLGHEKTLDRVVAEFFFGLEYVEM